LNEISLVEKGAEKDAHILGQGMKGKYFMVDGREVIKASHTSKRTTPQWSRRMENNNNNNASSAAQTPSDPDIITVPRSDLEAKLALLHHYQEQEQKQMDNEKKERLELMQKYFEGSSNIVLKDLPQKVDHLYKTPGGKEWIDIVCGVAKENHDLRTNLAEEQKLHDAARAAAKERDISARPTLERSTGAVAGTTIGSHGMPKFTNISEMMSYSKRNGTVVNMQNSANPAGPEPTIQQKVEMDLNAMRQGAKKLHLEAL
jgi:hypothetical protein